MKRVGCKLIQLFTIKSASYGFYLAMYFDKLIDNLYFTRQQYDIKQFLNDGILDKKHVSNPRSILSKTVNNIPNKGLHKDISNNMQRDDETKNINDRPIIGILAQECQPYFTEELCSTSYIAASYVKYIESAGARVVPVLINQPEEYYQTIFDSTNGLLIPGGDVSLVDSGTLKALNFSTPRC